MTKQRQGNKRGPGLIGLRYEKVCVLAILYAYREYIPFMTEKEILTILYGEEVPPACLVRWEMMRQKASASSHLIERAYKRQTR